MVAQSIPLALRRALPTASSPWAALGFVLAHAAAWYALGMSIPGLVAHGLTVLAAALVLREKALITYLVLWIVFLSAWIILGAVYIGAILIHGFPFSN